ncbi:osmoprotectant transport system permease protein [Kibdelosporangium banguiense]|uniref:Osmoprotectant transport system permease protein n=1 Tax=Kibdelosporangium banguiense TaxID=1365924 RepID=A0ABS4TV10_9PSEU|nr:ABC transporter permease [Kibdelosporangium banguiense]MBP2327761.1 osmoprotectant transport system permease protein [Kibdelosporangium banguiense]
MTAVAVETKRAAGLRMFAQPIAVVVLVTVVLVWAFTQDLDAIEKQSINAPVLLGAVWDHLVISFVVTGLVLVIAVPLGIVLTRRWARRAAPFFLAIATIGQASPTIGILVLFFLLSGWEGLWAAALPITFYTLLPVLRNTMVGLQQIDPALVDAGRGIGMSAFAVLRRIELPLAIPLILAGLRTALVHAVGVATMAVFVNGGGLGLLIDTGYKLSRITVLITGAVLAVALALLVDWLGAVAEQYLGPKGLR